MIIVMWILVIIQVWVLFNGSLLPVMKHHKDGNRHANIDQPLVSILVPMRNEERHAADCIDSLKQLDYDALQIVIIDDGSTDETATILEEAIDQDPRFSVIKGTGLPEGWVGKVHACHQLSKHAQGDYYLFVDADVRLEPETVQESISLMKAETGLLSGFPNYPLKGILGHLIVPLQHVIIHLHLPVMFANFTKWPMASAAHGAFMFFRKEAYLDAGGHEAVKQSLVEDVHITRAIKKAGWNSLLVNPTRLVTCHMYESNQEVWNGFSKNIYPGIGRNPILALLLVLFYAGTFVSPVFFALHGLFTGLFVSFIPLLLTISIKISIDVMSRQKWWLGLFMPVSMLLLSALIFYSMYLGLAQKGFTWKGRTYS
ncbi:glycosyltransferase [Salisediminibacterium selenitireducens]|uniref:Glycosyl transferase family 2 n=1 Tax=Bacillus selenitireducens (strain ATCC 700615 / DSM 15326 / MLS10) TaxID=439292 RepID=D6XVH7_BACIE|nr:glycosyltransferase family 2 protein [Salisediminibacterium selenitireducens]ADH99715.1 glycosyl transferase family 2 [[Bacillus] selenitireducens MLS10]